MQMSLRSAESTLAAAGSLLGKLNGEKVSWTSQSEEHAQALKTLPACAAVAAAFMTYTSCESEPIRQGMMHSWMLLDSLQLPVNFSFQTFLSSESELLQWKAEGLQGDQACITTVHCCTFLH